MSKLSAVPVIHFDSAPRTADVEAKLTSLSQSEREALITKIKRLLREKNAVVIAHYYVHRDIQIVAEETGGCVSDSLEMARFGHRHPAPNLIVAGVRFMGETAKILNYEKRVFMPTLEAECSLDLGCPAEEFIKFCDTYPDRTVVVYSNTSAAVKARADWVVTSSIAIDVVKHLQAQDKKIIWAPDRYLGDYIQKTTGANMLIWQASCIVHEEFRADVLRKLKAQYPDAAVLVHPESTMSVIEMADVVGSTSQLIQAAKKLPHKRLIVATDNGIFYKMQQAALDKELIGAPTSGLGATCKSCGHCPWMAMNDLERLAHVLESGENEIFVPKDIAEKAACSTKRMIDFVEQRKR